MNSVALTPDGKTAGLEESVPKNLKDVGDVELGKEQQIKEGRQRFRWNLVLKQSIIELSSIKIIV